MESLPLIAIVGPTASGKTGLAIKLAKEFNGEIISADSRAVYRGLDIGTAKPTLAERQGVPHWGFDLVNPGDRVTAADFKNYAVRKIYEIRERGNIPIIVGGTGLYVDAVVYDFQFTEGTNDVARRDELLKKSLQYLHEYCYKNNIKLPENENNKRYVVNVILRNGVEQKRRKSPLENTIIVGITTEKNVLRQRLHTRALEIFSGDIVAETLTAAKSFGWSNEAMTGNVYPLIRQLSIGDITQTEAIERFEVLDWRLAKRQLTWLRRDPYILWLELEQAYTYLARQLAKLSES